MGFTFQTNYVTFLASTVALNGFWKLKFSRYSDYCILFKDKIVPSQFQSSFLIPDKDQLCSWSEALSETKDTEESKIEILAVSVYLIK